jgi:serine/threonine protein kinase
VSGEETKGFPPDPDDQPGDAAGPRAGPSGLPPTAFCPPPEQVEALPLPSGEPRARRAAPPDALTLTAGTVAPGDTTARIEPPQVSGYRALAKLGRGTYGEVWLYEEERTRIHVAIKFFAHGRGERWQFLQQEVRQLALLHADPGIVQLEDVEPHADPPYYVMSYAVGGSLARRLDDGRPLPLPEALRIFRQVTEALAYVHAKGIRHCDLKPGNILLDARGRALVADFGQAHLSSDLSPALGTFFYMAPEQADLARPIPDTRWDVYGLGALFYHMVTGQPPREDPNLHDTLAASADLDERLRIYREAVRRAPRPAAHRRVPGMDCALATLIDRCLEIDPDRRLRDAGAVLAALDARQRARRRRPLLYFSLAVPVLLLAAMAVGAWVEVSTAARASEQALAQQVQQSDLAGARLVASVVTSELQDRIDALRKYRHSHNLASEIKEGHWGRLRDMLQEWHARQETEQGQELFFRVFVSDAEGCIQADWPTDPGTVSRNWAWRDWFHGGGDCLDPAGRTFQPIRAPHVSQPFVSHIKGTPVSLCVSVPCFDPQDRERPAAERRVVGLLVGQIEADKVYRWLSGVNMESGFAVLYNEHGHCLLHRNDEAIRPVLDVNPRSWTEDCPTLRRVLEPPDGTLEYQDPVDGRRYLAGHAPVAAGAGQWGALVQHEKEAALRPVGKLRRSLALVGWISLGAVTLLTAGMWAWLLAALRRDERLPV